MNSGIYLITNVVNCKVYLGSSKNIKKRKYEHFYMLKNGRHANPHLQRAYTSYGKQAFHFEVLEYCQLEDLQKREEWWIAFFDSRNPSKGYNLLSADRKEISEESRAKMAAAKVGRKWPEERIAKRSATVRGSRRSDETKAKLSAIHKGKPWTEARRKAQEDRGARDVP